MADGSDAPIIHQRVPKVAITITLTTLDKLQLFIGKPGQGHYHYGINDNDIDTINDSH